MLNYHWFLNRFILPLGDFLVGGNYLKYLKSWQKFDKTSEKDLKDIQASRLKDILKSAIENVPFYAKVQGPNIEAFPILTKDLLRYHSSELVSRNETISQLKKHHSSGSSGVQSFTYMTKDHEYFLRSLQTHWWTWGAYRLGDHLLQFGISQQRSFLKTVKDLFYRCTYVKAFGLSEEELKDTLQKVSSKKNLVIAGYPSVIN
ncbi:MAG: hypothetical protein HRU26_03575, partial [Psychroserpens sp.]|nr:hypothetical protein [Psychroserpens sp.]